MKKDIEKMIEKVKKGDWFANMQVGRKIEIVVNMTEGLPLLSVGEPQVHSCHNVPKKYFAELTQLGFELCKDDKNKTHVYATTKEMAWITICNFRRYGWCVAPGYEATHWYDGPIFANGDGIWDASKIGKENYLRVELSRLVEIIRSKSWYYGDFDYALRSKAFSEALDALVKEALEHPQDIKIKSGIIEENKRVKLTINRPIKAA
jgi:hypothetical protein